MSTQENKNIALRYMQTGVNEGNVDAALFSGDFAFYFPGAPVTLNLAGLEQATRAFHGGFPDQHTTVDDIVADDDRVAARFTFRGTQTGEFQGIPPTGKPVTMNGMAFWRIADGEIVEHWVVFDAMGMMQQLGVIPAA